MPDSASPTNGLGAIALPTMPGVPVDAVPSFADGVDALAAGAMAYADDRFDDARVAFEQAFRLFRDAGDDRAAARVASALGELHWDMFGNHAAGRGWLERGRRLLERAGPCVEWGYWELARMACERPDVDELASSAARALEIAEEFGDYELEVRALADSGFALVAQGHVREGFERLDAALAALAAGEVRDPWVLGATFCTLLSSCDRAGDLPRATEVIRVAKQLVIDPMGGRPRVLATHCQVAFGGVLCSIGEWSEAESVILDALGPDASDAAGHRVDATARLAELRLRQGRLDEAVELVAQVEDRVGAASIVAEVHLARGDAALAAAVLRRAVKELVGDVLRGAPAVALLVDASLALDDADSARDASVLLDAMASAGDVAMVDVLASRARGRIALATDAANDAIAEFERALATVDAAGRPALAMETHLDLAAALEASGDGPGAVAAARAAHAAATRFGVTAVRDRSAAMLRRLGAVAPRPNATATAIGELTAREVEVLDGMRRGETNAEIAARLYLSPKTVEHHVSRVLAKLGVRSRAEAAAIAASTRSGAD